MNKKVSILRCIWSVENFSALGLMCEIDMPSKLAERENHWFLASLVELPAEARQTTMNYVSTTLGRKISKAVKGTPTKRAKGRATGSIELTESMLLEAASRSIRLRDGGEFTSGSRRGQETGR